MAPLLKLLLHAPLFLGISFAQQPQLRPTLAEPTSTPTPQATAGIWDMIFEPGAFSNMLPYWEVGNSTKVGHDMVDDGPDANGRYKSHRLPKLFPTACPAKNWRTWISGNPATRTVTRPKQWHDACENHCLRQYMTPVTRRVYSYDKKKCSKHTSIVTINGTHWGDSNGLLIPMTKWYSKARWNTTDAIKPSHCKKPKKPKTGGKKPSKTSTSKRSKKKQTPLPKPECTDYHSCFDRCEKVRKTQDIIIYILLGALGAAFGGFIAFKVIRRVRRSRGRKRRREPSGESGPVTTVEEVPVEEVVQVEVVEPIPEKQKVEEKVPEVVVEQPTPTGPKSQSADGTSDDVDKRNDHGRLGVPSTKGSDLHGSEGGARSKV